MNFITSYSNILFVLSIGLVLGALSAFGHTYLPHDFSPLSTSYSVWLVSAFVAGLFALTKRQSLIFGVATPIAIFISAYFLLKIFLDGGVVISGLITMLLIGSILIGPALGYLAYKWKQRGDKAVVIAPVLVSSLLISEGLAHIVSTVPDVVGYIYVALGIAAFALLYRPTKERLLVIPMIGAIIPVSIVIYFLFIMAFAVVLTIQLWGSGYNEF